MDDDDDDDDNDDDDDDIWNTEVSRRSIIKHIKNSTDFRGLMYNGGPEDPLLLLKTLGWICKLLQ